jgi:DNA-binding GntR family transcriptional regulator
VNAEHARIVDATLQRRSDEACGLLRDHIERTGHNVMVALLEKRATPATGK